MTRLMGSIAAAALLLALGSTADAQMTIQLGNGTQPTINFGQPAYGAYGSPYYGQNGYAQPYGYNAPYYGQRNYARPFYGQANGTRYYSSGYSGYNQGWNRGYASPYGTGAYTRSYVPRRGWRR